MVTYAQFLFLAAAFLILHRNPGAAVELEHPQPPLVGPQDPNFPANVPWKPHENFAGTEWDRKNQSDSFKAFRITNSLVHTRSSFVIVQTFLT
ncbi:hypothetical protein EG68_12343 [Paragonimus skrjabini miyazakii]|uniref:Secreted protein n=1 Tax=Paragonimus skrjabini miyazakii TaxID=59628 RepID=A0A8S9YFP8_9TREM|nr:hypothetical protein EG68_12343 [Paragonimus skrjabini miyazakii]